jgi:transcriptional regulator GlxA family with amidase domain
LHGLAGLAELTRADVVIVPSWRNVDELAAPALLQALRDAHARGAVVMGLCLGAYVLAQAGLLDGMTATTHWAFADDFAARFPALTVAPDSLYLDDGQVLTSAGTAAAIDCCLHLLRRQCGAAAAGQVARYLVTPPHRQGGQAQYIAQPLPANTRDDRLSGLLDEVRASLAAPHTLDSLAARVLMSRRTFTRHFRQLTGSTVQQWLLAERLARAQQLLETTALPVEAIAQQAGFGSAPSLRLHFRRRFGVAPGDWRRSFAG